VLICMKPIFIKVKKVARFEIGVMKADKKMCEHLKITKEKLYEINTSMHRQYYDETYFYSWGFYNLVSSTAQTSQCANHSSSLPRIAFLCAGVLSL
jgi:hypothetical protein